MVDFVSKKKKKTSQKTYTKQKKNRVFRAKNSLKLPIADNKLYSNYIFILTPNFRPKTRHQAIYDKKGFNSKNNMQFGLTAHLKVTIKESLC